MADISHEPRTPLALLRASIEAVQDGVRGLDQDALAGLHADALRLGRLVDDLYELSVTDLGALSYRKQPVDWRRCWKPRSTASGRAFRRRASRSI